MESHGQSLLADRPQPVVADPLAPPRSTRDSAITVSRISGRGLTDEQICAWSKIQCGIKELDSPFLHPHFTRSVAAVRSDVEVAALEQDGKMVGFFPYQRSRQVIGNPVGGRLNDCQALIARADLRLDPSRMLGACGLLTWKFDHLLTTQSWFQASHWNLRRSLQIHVPERFDCSAAEGLRSRRVRETLRKTRKFERERGPIRFILHETDPRAFQALLRWKSAQYRRTDAMDIFSLRWPIELLERLNQEPSVELCGQLSALYLGDRLAAVHQGLRSNRVLHSWFPAYDPTIWQFSPGMMLFVRLAQEAESNGIARIDLGAGEAGFKQSLASSATMVATGAVTRFALHRGAQRGWNRTKAWLRTSPLQKPWRAVADRTRPLRDWFAMR
ncbi:MAG TPA: GNAT family N-acetyltransferase [Pirellulales bacterium]|jgi:CelD/BcsL family acetyltransferase involved in cellulose biosynthesis|nr:GNAT family N-acetyltransferase [Pirellulales bacterium]